MTARQIIETAPGSMAYNHPSQLRKFMKPGTVWSRVNHQHPSQVGGELMAEKGEPVLVKVHAVTKEGVELEIVDKPGTISYLTWPDPLAMWMTTEPNRIAIENRYGLLLTHTRTAQQESFQLAEAEDPKVFLKAQPPTDFYVDAEWEQWHVDGRGNILQRYEVSKLPRRAMLHSVKRFDVEEYRQATGHRPPRQVPFKHLGYWTHGDVYVACQERRR